MVICVFTVVEYWNDKLYCITKRAGKKEGNGLMKANAWHHRADAISSVVAQRNPRQLKDGISLIKCYEIAAQCPCTSINSWFDASMSYSTTD